MKSNPMIGRWAEATAKVQLNCLRIPEIENTNVQSPEIQTGELSVVTSLFEQVEVSIWKVLSERCQLMSALHLQCNLS